MSHIEARLPDEAVLQVDQSTESLLHAPSLASTASIGPDTPTSDESGLLAVGTRAGGCVIQRILGRGGMGVVYLAEQQNPKRLVALKMIRTADPGQEALRRFFAEAQAVASLEHPGIVQVHVVGQHEGRPYMVLEYVEGGSLEDRLRPHKDQPAASDVPQSATWSAEIVEQLALAMHIAHSRNIVHRDLKPANILLSAKGKPKICDFGLARFLDSDLQRTDPGSMLGTPLFMAPEQAAGLAHEAGAAADIYALGAILYKLLTGRPPFEGRSRAEVYEQVKNQEPTPPSKLFPSIPRDLETICLKCLRKEPERRYASAQELAGDLRRFLEHRPIFARRVHPAERLVLWCRRQPYVAASLAALVLVVAMLSIVGARWQASAEEVARVERETSTAIEQLVEASSETRRDARQALSMDEIEKLFGKGLDQARQANEQARRGPVSAAILRMAEQALKEAEEDHRAHEKDRRLLAKLVEVLIFAESWDYTRDKGSGEIIEVKPLDPERCFADAFRAWGLDPDAMPIVAAAEQIRSRPVAVTTEVIAALDQWAYLRRSQQRHSAQPLWGLANAADESNPRRRELRSLLASSAPGGLGGTALNSERIAALAKEVNPATEPTLTLLVLARALWETKSANTMEELLRAAVHARPKDALLRAHLGVMYLLQGAPEGFGPVARLNAQPAALSGFQLVARLFGQKASTDPVTWKFPVPANNQSHFRNAEECFEALRAQHPEYRILLAISKVHTERHAEGLEFLREIQQERPDDPLPLLLEAYALNVQGDSRGAMEAARRASQHGGASELGHLGRLSEAQSALETKEWAKAESLCREILASATTPTFRSFAHERLAAALHGQGNTPEAIQEFGESLRISQGIPSGHVYLAQKLESVNDLAGAERLLVRGFQEDPTNAAMLLYAIEFCRKRGMTSEAQRIEEMLAQAELPADTRSLYQAGITAGKLQLYELAEKALRQVLASEPNHALGHEGLSQILRTQGKTEEADNHHRMAEALRAATDKGNPVP